ncbi:MAG: hypothetical protein ABI977_31215 [Acidobacteriota bacterium]
MSTSRLKALSLSVLCLVLTLLSITASAQTITATVGGTVADEAGAVVMNAKVTVTAVNDPANFGIVRTQGNQPRLIQLVLRYTF